MTQIYTPPQPFQWSWITLIGPDAGDFLHRLTTVNVRNLIVGEGAPGCFLTPQGKLRAYFTLWNYRLTEFAFEIDAGESGHWKKALLETIDQYTFGEKITVAEVPLESRWIFPDAEGLAKLGVAESMKTAAIDEEIRVCHHGEADFGRPWVTVWGRGPRLAQWLERAFPQAQSIGFETTETWRIEASRPRADLELSESTIPLEVGLKDAIAENKGCYPGQEVIEKIISLGAPAKRLIRIDGSGPVPARGEKILNLADPAAEVGEVTSVAETSTGFVALGIVRKIHAKEGLEVRFTTGSQGTVARVAPYR